MLRRFYLFSFFILLFSILEVASGQDGDDLNGEPPVANEAQVQGPEGSEDSYLEKQSDGLSAYSTGEESGSSLGGSDPDVRRWLGNSPIVLCLTIATSGGLEEHEYTPIEHEYTRIEQGHTPIEQTANMGAGEFLGVGGQNQTDAPLSPASHGPTNSTVNPPNSNHLWRPSRPTIMDGQGLSRSNPNEVYDGCWAIYPVNPNRNRWWRLDKGWSPSS